MLVDARCIRGDAFLHAFEGNYRVWLSRDFQVSEKGDKEIAEMSEVRPCTPNFMAGHCRLHLQQVLSTISFIQISLKLWLEVFVKMPSNFPCSQESAIQVEPKPGTTAWSSFCDYRICKYGVDYTQSERLCHIWMFPKIGVGPQNGWFTMENPMNKWMIWGAKKGGGSLVPVESGSLVPVESVSLLPV